jgi:outer membrane protein OmpA-like peptidoglycan-associated protein
MMRFSMKLVCIAALALGAAQAEAAKGDVDLERLSRSLAQLEQDAKLGVFAGAEIARARAALGQLSENGRGKKRTHYLYIAERRVDLAWAAAQVADFTQQQASLEREHDRLQLAAARHEAEQARRELEQQRLLAQIRAEEAERQAEEARQQGELEMAAAREEAEQAQRLADAQAREAALARKEAQLAAAAADALRQRLKNVQATRGDRGMQMTLDDVAFGPGRSTLRPEAEGLLGNLIEFVERDPNSQIRIEGHTDSTGNANANQLLSQKRADSVREALIASGVDGSRISAVGFGSDHPVASDDTAEGRAKNRRVEVILVGKQ